MQGAREPKVVWFFLIQKSLYIKNSSPVVWGFKIMCKTAVAVVLWSYPLIGWLRIWKSLIMFICSLYAIGNSIICSSLQLASQSAQGIHAFDQLREIHAFDEICAEKTPAPHLPPQNAQESQYFSTIAFFSSIGSWANTCRNTDDD